MKTYTEARGYEAIQNDIINSFNILINKSKEDIRVLVIAGAYHGYEIDSFLNIYPNVEIYAFEAYLDHFKILQSRFLGNKRVKCFNYAVSNTIEDAIFYEITNAGSGSLLKFKEIPQHRISNTVPVKSVTISSILKDMPIDLLWVDTQGTELDVLEGTNLSLVNAMFLEITLRDGLIAYENNCLLDEIEEYTKNTHYLYSIGLDNESHNGTGNSFWLRKEYA